MFLTQLTEFNFVCWFRKELFGQCLLSYSAQLVSFTLTKLQSDRDSQLKGLKLKRGLRVPDTPIKTKTLDGLISFYKILF